MPPTVPAAAVENVGLPPAPAAPPATLVVPVPVFNEYNKTITPPRPPPPATDGAGDHREAREGRRDQDRVPLPALRPRRGVARDGQESRLGLQLLWI